MDTAGNAYVTGFSDTGTRREFRTIKYSPNGTRLWSVGFDGSGRSTGEAYAIALDAGGNAYVTGFSREHDGASEDWRTVKYAAFDGHVVWERTYDGPDHGPDRPLAIAVDGAGNALVTGTTWAPWGYEFRTLKYAAADGRLVWDALSSWPGGQNDAPVAIAVDGAGNAVVTGKADGEFRTIKYDAASGRALWSVATSAVPGEGNEARALALDSAGDVYVGGTTYGPNGSRFRTVKYAAADGSQLWSASYDGPGADELSALALDAQGGAYVTGTSAGAGTYDYRTIKYAAADGSLLWSVAWDGASHGIDFARALAVDSAGNPYATGLSGTANGNEFRTIKYASANGSVLWSASYHAPTWSDDQGLAVVVDPSGDAIVVGSSMPGFDFDIRTLKYDGPTGATLFSAGAGVVKGLQERLRSPSSLAVDAAGNSYLAGPDLRNGPGGPFDFRVVKQGPSGDVLWSMGYDSPAHGDDVPVAVAVDSRGDVYVAGTSESGGALPDFRIVKLAASDGHLVWSAVYASSANSGGGLHALALDAVGNAYVAGIWVTGQARGCRVSKFATTTGSPLWTTAFACANMSQAPLALDVHGNALVAVSTPSAGGYAFATLKLAAGDGSQRWAATDDRGADPDDTPPAIAVDSAGNALVTGDRSTYGFLTVKHAATDGRLLWSAAYVPAAGDASAKALALDSAGNVFVTGLSTASGSSGFGTTKYAALDGRQLWSVAYDTPAHGVAPSAIAVDATGDAYVTGSASGGLEFDQWTSDYRTVKLAASDGHVLWSMTYDGAHGNDDALAVTVRSGAAYVAGTSLVPATGYDFLTIKYVPDVVAPLAPANLWSATHMPGTWSNGGAIGMRWSGAVDPPPSGGLEGYSVAFDASAGTVPDLTVDLPQTTDPQATTSATLSEGQSHYFHVRACDQGGNCSPAKHAGPYWIDTTAPVAPPTLTSSSHTPGVPSNLTTLALQWTASSDPLSNGVASGIDGYGWAVDDGSSAPCRQIKLAEEWVTTATVELAPGTWYAHVCARDNAGNWSGVASAGPYLIGDPADLSLALTDDVDPIHVNGMVTYTATYGNGGPSLALSTVLRATLPPGLGFVSSVPAICSAEASDAVLCALGDVPASGGGTVEITVQALPGTKGQQVVSAKLRAATSDPDLANNDATQSTLVKFVKGDLQDDWATDLFLRNVTTGENLVWLMNGTTRLSQAPIDPATPAQATQQVAGVDDFDGDGRNDLAFWDTATGAVEFWLMNGPTRVGGPQPLAGAPPAAWKLSATADFDHDGRPDLLWRNAQTQKLVVWTMNGTAKAGEIVPSPDQAAHANWDVVGAVDLNGDGNVDLLWYNASTGKVVYWWMDAALHRITGNFTNPPNAGSANWRVLATGDYGAGAGGVPDTTDLVWRNDTTGRFVVWHMDLAGNRTAGTFTTPDQPDTTPLDWTIVGPR